MTLINRAYCSITFSALLTSHALEGNTTARVVSIEASSFAPLPRFAGLNAEAKAESVTDRLEQAKQREILGSDDDQAQERRVIKFLQLVALPLLVCLGLILLLRRGLFGG